MSTDRKEGGEGAGEEEEAEVVSLSKHAKERKRKGAASLSHLAILSTCSSGVECVRWS